MLLPKLITTLRVGYTRQRFAADLTAGVIVGIVALPLSIAFGIASGATPEAGLFTAIIGGFLVSALGGSRVQIGGPTGAFVVIVAGVIQQYGMDGLLIATMMVGVMLVGLGLAKLGAAIKFIPYPVTTGFTTGIALIIFSSQVKDFFGLRMTAVPAEFVAKWVAYANNVTSVNLWAIAVAAGSLAILILWPRVSLRVPAPFVALLVASIATSVGHLPVETIGDRFGTIHASLPSPHLPAVSWDVLRGLVAPAFTIALLAAIESLLSAVVADGMIGSRHRSNMELVAQGVANIASPLFGGIPVTGAIARTATNVKNGGRTPVAGITHAVTLLLITLFFGSLVARIPMATLAAILVVVSYNMSEWRRFRGELRAPTDERRGRARLDRSQGPLRCFIREPDTFDAAAFQKVDHFDDFSVSHALVGAQVNDLRGSSGHQRPDPVLQKGQTHRLLAQKRPSFGVEGHRESIFRLILHLIRGGQSNVDTSAHHGGGHHEDEQQHEDHVHQRGHVDLADAPPRSLPPEGEIA